MEKMSRSRLGIEKSEITEDLTKYYDKVNKDNHWKSIVLQSYETVEDFVDILYWIKFVKKLDYHEMGELTGSVDFYQCYYNNTLFWHYNADTLEECERLYSDELVGLKAKQQKARFVPEKDLPQQYFDFIRGIKAGTIHLKVNKNNLAQRYGVESFDLLLRELYYLHHVEELTTRELSILYDKTKSTISGLKKKLGLGMSLQEAQQRVVGKGRHDYAKAFQSKRKTLVRSVAESGLTGSNEENLCRLIIADNLINLIGSEHFEIVVGVSDRTIIAPLEIDIPIIILKDTGEVWKFAIEYNGSVWHKDRKESDIQKAEQLRKKGWKYFSIESYSDYGAELSRSKKFERDIVEFCEMLANEILKGLRNE